MGRPPGMAALAFPQLSQNVVKSLIVPLFGWCPSEWLSFQACTPGADLLKGWLCVLYQSTEATTEKAEVGFLCHMAF